MGGREGGEGEGRDGEGGEIGPPRFFDKFTPMSEGANRNLPAAYPTVLSPTAYE